MTKEQLEQYLDLKREISQLEAVLKSYSTESPPMFSDSVSKSQHSLPYKKITASVIGIDYDKIESKRERLRSNIKKAEKQLTEIENFIDSINDSQIRQIIYWRYIKGHSWLSVAFKIGKHDEGTPRKKIEKFLKNSENSESGVI